MQSVSTTGLGALSAKTIGPVMADRSAAITSLLHGDEDSGLLVITDLFHGLGNSWRPTGRLDLVPVANPSAALHRSRVAPADLLDANRVGAGNAAGQITEQQVRELRDIVGRSSLVINLHSFETRTGLAGVFVEPQDPAVRSIALQALAVANLDYVLSMPHSLGIASFDLALCDMGVPSISIELPRADQCGPEVRRAAVTGLLRILDHLGVAEILVGSSDIPAERTAKGNRSGTVPQCYTREVVRTSELGIWRPQVDLGAKAHPGDVLGTMLHAPSLATSEVRAPTSPHHEPPGTVIQLRPQEVVRPNDILFGIAHPDPKLRYEMRDSAGL